MTKKILCRADGDAKIGLGHLYRMLAIMAFYKDEYELVFLTQSNSITSIIPSEYTIKLIPEGIKITDEPDWIASQYSSLEYIIIADGYQFVSNYQKEIKDLGYTLIYVDDLKSEHIYADVVINHSPHCTTYNFKSETYTQFALGTGYAMLRPQFNMAAKLKRSISSIENAFVCFGGADQYDLSLKATIALLNNKLIKQVNVVLGAGYNHQKIYDLAEENERLHLHKNLDEIALYNLMSSCQVAIAPSSTILYELCSVKMPIFSGYYVENQKNINSSFFEKQVIFNGGDLCHYSSLDFERQFEIFFKNIDIDAYIDKQQELFDGKNKKRFLSLLNQLNISSRNATRDDLMMVYVWSNDELVRQNSYNSAPILFKDHINWFLKKIEDSQTLFLIIEVNNKPAGIVRFEISKLNTVVGIIVSKAYRGQNLASCFLKKGADVYFEKYEKPILAYIKKENVASIKSFEKAKYIYFKQETMQGNRSFVYKLEKSNVVK